MITRYGTNSIVFYYDSIHDLFDELNDKKLLHTGTPYWEADFTQIPISQLLNAESVIEMANDAGYEEMGEIWDNHFDVSRQAKQELQSMLEEWASKYVDVSQCLILVRGPRRWVVSAMNVLEHSSSYMDLSGNLDAPLP